MNRAAVIPASQETLNQTIAEMETEYIRETNRAQREL